jgi:CRISPR-associated protein Csb2
MWLPKAAFREVRYYQPLEQKRALHHDFFAVPVGGRFYFVFDTSLSEKQQQFLDTLLKRVLYFGRGESRATLRRVDLAEPPSDLFRVLPRERGTAGAWSPRPVLCPSADRDFRASDLWASRQQASGRKRKKAKNAANKGGNPVHLVDALLSDRKSLPDGSLRIEYAQPDSSIVQEIPAAKRAQRSIPEIVEVRSIRFRLCRRVPISMSDVVAVARGYRDEAVRIFKAANPDVRSRALTGREEDGSVSRGNQHIYYLPQPMASGPGISTLVVAVPVGLALTKLEMDALMAVERIRLRRNDRYPISVVSEVVNGDDTVASQRWRSLTPFLPPLHHRPGRAETCPNQQLASCVRSVCDVTPRVIPVSGPAGSGARTLVRVHEYASTAQGAPTVRHWRLTRRFAQWFTIEFSTPVMLTQAFGKDAHFGLGQFTPVTEAG